MADDLEPIRQEFIADMADYVEPMRESEDEARRFADENRVAADEIRDLARAVRDNTDEIRRLATALVEDNHELSVLRDRSAEASAAIGHLRDESLEAAAAEREMGDSARDASRKLDLMGLSGLSTGQKVFAMVGLMGTLVGVAASVAPAFAAAGLGLGAFALFALPVLKQAKGEVTQFKNELNTLGKSSGLQSMALGDIKQVFGILDKLLPVLIPLAKQGAIAVHDLLSSLGGGLQSGGFLSFLHQMSAQVVPAMHAITGLAGALLGLLGHALEALAPLAAPLLNMITGLIRALSGPLVALLGVFQQMLFAVLRAIQPMLPGLSKLATLLINDVGKGLESLIPVVSQVIQLLGPALMTILLDLEPVLANLLTPNSGFLLALKAIPAILKVILPLFTGLASILKNPIFATIASDAITAFVAFKALSAVLGYLRVAFVGLTAVMEVNPIILIITAIALLVIGIVELTRHSAAFRDFWKGVWKVVSDAALAAWHFLQQVFHDIESVVDHAISFIRSHWALITAILTGPIGIAVYLLVRYWNDIVRGVQSMVSTVIGWFHNLVSRILGAVAGFGRLLWNAGANLIHGLIGGVESMVGTLVGYIKNVGSWVSGAFSSVLSIFSPSQVFFQHGVHTIQGYINGVLSMMPAMKAAMHQAASSVLPQQIAALGGYGTGGANPGGLALAGVGGGAAPAPSGNLVVNVDGQRLFQIMQSQLYQYNIRNNGQVTGTVKPA